MGRKVFMSLLGVSFYGKCKYAKGNFTGSETPFIQKSLLEYLQQEEKWNEKDIALIFLTDLARQENWSRDIKSRFCPKRQKQVPYVGLEKILQDMGLPFKPISIPEGRDTQQMWEIFESIFEQLKEEDELFLDITNSFRYLPMLLLVLVNYAKMLKNVTVKAIYYGNYEARDINSNVAPIMDLLPLSVLQDWTSATSDYLRYGQVDKLYDLSESSIIPILKDPSTRTKDVELLRAFVNRLKNLADERITCRGKDIITNKNIGLLEQAAKDIQNVTIAQLKPVIEKIKESLDDFGAKENILNCIKAAKWCCTNKMFQQATTLLEEGLLTFLCCYFHLDYKVVGYRNIMAQCIHIKTQTNAGNEYYTEKSDYTEIKGKILADSIIWGNKDFVSSLQSVIELRNDYNHAGFNQAPQNAKNIIHKVERLMDNIETSLRNISLSCKWIRDVK